MKKISVALALSLCLAPSVAFAGDEGKESKEAKDDKDDKDDKGDGGKELGRTVEGENEKHAQRLAKLDRLDAIAKEKSRPELTDKVATLRAKEQKRHERVLARLAKKDDIKGEAADRKEAREDKRDDKRAEIEKKLQDKKAEIAAKKAEIAAKKAEKKAEKDAKKGGKKD